MIDFGNKQAVVAEIRRICRENTQRRDGYTDPPSDMVDAMAMDIVQWAAGYRGKHFLGKLRSDRGRLANIMCLSEAGRMALGEMSDAAERWEKGGGADERTRQET